MNTERKYTLQDLYSLFSLYEFIFSLGAFSRRTQELLISIWKKKWEKR